MESWFYILRNIHNFAGIPEGMDSRYTRVFESAKTNLVPDKERLQYLRVMLSDYDKQDIAEAYFKEGVEKNRRENALAMLADGVEEAKVAKYTGLSLEEIRELVQ